MNFHVSVFILLHEIVIFPSHKMVVGKQIFICRTFVCNSILSQDADLLPSRSVTCILCVYFSPLGLKFYAHRIDHSRRGKQKHIFGWLH